jgi:two-component system response regulator HydG
MPAWAELLMKDRVLVIDDDQDQCDLLADLVSRLDCTVTTTTSPTEALELIAQQDFDTVLTDLGMASMSGTELCSRVGATRPDVPVVVVTGMGSMESAIEAMRAGAYDFLNKPIDRGLLGIALARALQHHHLRVEVRQLRKWIESSPIDEMIGKGSAMRRVGSLVARVAARDATVLVQGETGTGKELVARAIQRASARRSGPFVAINCAAMPVALLESELFGHARGAFTDAKESREGLFVRASGGTLFLDEIGEMPLEMQAKLLRVLQERSVRPVGSDAEVAFDVRIVAATHRDLEAEVAAKRFREDLYYRINVVRIDVPPLRERTEDILVLATHFLGKAAKREGRTKAHLSSEVGRVLMAYDWPGNVRELENCMEHAAALARLDHITIDDLPERVHSSRQLTPSSAVMCSSAERILSLEELERRHIMQVLKLLEGNEIRAAELLGMDRRTLGRRVDRYKQEVRAAQTEDQSSPQRAES